MNIHEAMAEAKRSAGGRVVVIAHRRPEGRWLITIEAESFFEFLRGTLPPEGTGVPAKNGAARRELNKKTKD